MPLNSLPSVKTAKSSLARSHMGGGGGATGGTSSWDPRPLPWVRGSQYKKKVQGLRSKYTHSGHNTQRSFDPPQAPPPQKKGYPGAGGGGGVARVKIPKNHWGIIFGPKMMILQGLDVRNHTLGYATRTTPKKGGYTTLAPALHLTTSLRGDFGGRHCPSGASAAVE